MRALVAALIVSWPVYMFVRLVTGFVAGVRQELRNIRKEREDAKRRQDSEDNQRSERPDPPRDD